MSPDPVQAFEHDRVQCSNLVRVLGQHRDVARRKTFSRRQVVSVIERLRDQLFSHFAREEEGLFPFIVSLFPGTRKTVDRLIIAHDAICGTLSHLLVLTAQTSWDSDLTAFDELMTRFDSLYAEHTSTEMVLLQHIGERLDRAQRAKLFRLVRGL
jgi:iron-sulfur cluster repair protein YtfE (RIC family)